ncbi:hypothetical protein [Halomonas sp. 328]|uniref:hypothetical protein n=1 Tax=Halomonas sp. 328 TaxID=2776704 RepID=UPI0018A7525D|nr:hypothetical protein [Halomonas sp. 328]MBF8224410.1 hypothetical protein [Halomonas sp. 328]
MELKIWGTLAFSTTALAVALWIALAYYRSHRHQKASSESRETAPATAAPMPPPSTPVTVSKRHGRRPSREQTQALKQCWFVVFDTPSAQTNHGLAELLKARNAFYDAELGVYYVTSQSASYQLTIAHSSSPGRLPPLHQGDDHAPVDGISVLIKFINKQSVVRNPSTFIDLVMAAHALGGCILTTDREEIAPEAFQARLTDQAQPTPSP